MSIDMSSELNHALPIEARDPISGVQKQVFENFWNVDNHAFTKEDRSFVSAVNRVVLNTRKVEPENIAALNLSEAISLTINTKNDGDYLDESIKDLITDLFDPKNLPETNYIVPEESRKGKDLSSMGMGRASERADGIRALIINAIALDKESKAARRDALTGLYNKGMFTSELIRLTENKGSYGIVFLDLDHFKSVNDDFDHNTGDRVLTEIAPILELVTRPGDFLARIGGEEFAFIIRNIEKEVLEKKLEDLRSLIEIQLAPTSLSKKQLLKRPKITASTGFIHTGKILEKSAEEILEMYNQSDKAMYAAKEKGRNKVVDFDTIPTNTK